MNIVEEIFLKKDGSGRFVLSFDLSSLILMRDMLLIQSRIRNVDSLHVSAEKYDTTIYLNNIPDSVKRMFERPDLIQRSHVRVKVDVPERIMDLSIEFPFKDLEEINEFRRDINRYSQRRNTSLLKDDAALLGYLPSLKGSKGAIERSTHIPAWDEDSESAKLIRAFLSIARIKTIYHLPRRVKSTTIPGAIVKGRDCESEASYLEFISGKKSLDGRIIYK